MSPLGKIVTIGIALVTGTSLLTGITTAYMLRPAATTETMAATSPPDSGAHDGLAMRHGRGSRLAYRQAWRNRWAARGGPRRRRGRSRERRLGRRQGGFYWGAGWERRRGGGRGRQKPTK